MLKHGLARRFAFRILSLKGVGGSTTGVILAFGAITALLSAFVSNTATVAMLMPTALGILAVIARNTWAAIKGREALKEHWDRLERIRKGAKALRTLKTTG